MRSIRKIVLCAGVALLSLPASAQQAAVQPSPALSDLKLPAPQPAATAPGIQTAVPAAAPVIPAAAVPAQVPAVPGVPAAQAPAAAQPAAAPAAKVPDENDIALQQALQSVLPMSPDQILEFRRLKEQADQATSAPLKPLKISTRSVRVTLKPGEAPPALRLAPSNVSTLTFSDVTGKPWPVLSVTTGNPQAFQANVAGPEGQSPIVVVSTLQYYQPSNLVVTLVDNPVPVTIKLEVGQPEADYRLDVVLEGRGPNASYDITGVTSLAPVGDSLMISFLDGVPPSGAVKLVTGSADVEAWKLEDMVYIRTSGDLLSPSYISKSSNVSGTNVYVLSETPVLLVSKDGRMSQVSVGGPAADPKE